MKSPGKTFLSKNIRTAYPTLKEGWGCHVVDSSGKSYLDLCAQSLNLNFGMRDREILKILDKKTTKLAFASSRFMDEDAVGLARELVKFFGFPHGVANVKLTGGSEANEDALKRAILAGKNGTYAAPFNSFFGCTIATLELTGQYFDKKDSPFLNKSNALYFNSCTHGGSAPGRLVQNANCNCHVEIEDLLKKHVPDAVFIEPINVNAGVLIPTIDYLRRLRKLCRDYQTALVFDEVQTAFWGFKSGSASGEFGVRPDMITLAKGLSAGLHLGACVMDAKFDVLRYGHSEFTAGAVPADCAVARLVLKRSRNPATIKHAKELAEVIRKTLLPLTELKCVKAIRGYGVIWGIEFTGSRKTPASVMAEKVQAICRESNPRVIVRISDAQSLDNAILIKPAINMKVEELKSCLAVVVAAINSYNK